MDGTVGYQTQKTSREHTHTHANHKDGRATEEEKHGGTEEDSSTRTSGHEPQRDRPLQRRPRPGTWRSGCELPLAPRPLRRRTRSRACLPGSYFQGFRALRVRGCSFVFARAVNLCRSREAQKCSLAVRGGQRAPELLQYAVSYTKRLTQE